MSNVLETRVEFIRGEQGDAAVAAERQAFGLTHFGLSRRVSVVIATQQTHEQQTLTTPTLVGGEKFGSESDRRARRNRFNARASSDVICTDRQLNATANVRGERGIVPDRRPTAWRWRAVRCASRSRSFAPCPL